MGEVLGHTRGLCGCAIFVQSVSGYAMPEALKVRCISNLLLKSLEKEIPQLPLAILSALKKFVVM